MPKYQDPKPSTLVSGFHLLLLELPADLVDEYCAAVLGLKPLGAGFPLYEGVCVRVQAFDQLSRC
jgi:hypothetical protein